MIGKTTITVGTSNTHRDHNRFWLCKKERELGKSDELDRVVKCWIRVNENYGGHGRIFVDNVIGYTWGSFPGNEQGFDDVKQELGDLKVWSTY